MKQTIGFGRIGSQLLLTQSLKHPPVRHQYEHWRGVAHELGITLPRTPALFTPSRPTSNTVLVHSGAAQRVRVWPLRRYLRLVHRIREHGHEVLLACDPNQLDWWKAHGEPAVVPTTVDALLGLMSRVGAFIGNDSGPGHIAAICGVPTLTIFGPQLPERFAPLHPSAIWIEGKPCPYKPCSDYCRFPAPHCIEDIGEDAVWAKAASFLTSSFSR